MENKLINPIEEYLDHRVNRADFIELFEAKETDIDLKTELTFPEITIVNCILFNDNFLKKKGIPSPYNTLILRYLRLKVSMGRKSREEFVRINQHDKFKENMDTFNSFSQIKKVKE
jgi:hypothetical protein